MAQWSFRNTVVSAIASVDRGLVRRGHSRRWYRLALRRVAGWLLPESIEATRVPKRRSKPRDDQSVFDTGGVSEPARVNPHARGFGPLPDAPVKSDVARRPPAPPRIGAMRRAAMIDLFEQAGLELLPAQIWPYVQSQPTIDAAALRFLADVGLDGAAIMRGEKAALRRANALLLLLAEIEGAFSRLAPGAKNRLERALFSGNLAKVRAAVEIVAAYEAIVRMLDRWPDDRRFPAFRAFAAAIQAELGDPLASSRDDADEAQKIADDLSRVMGQIDHAGRRYAVVVDTLEAADYGSWATATDVVREMALIESLFTEIRDTDLATSDIVALLAAIDAAIDKLEAALRAHGGTGRGSRGGGRSGATADPVLTELEQALLFFGYSKADRPTWDDIQSRYKDRIKSVHPDLGGSEAATKELNGHRDILRRAFKPG